MHICKYTQHNNKLDISFNLRKEIRGRWSDIFKRHAGGKHFHNFANVCRLEKVKN